MAIECLEQWKGDPHKYGSRELDSVPFSVHSQNQMNFPNKRQVFRGKGRFCQDRGLLEIRIVPWRERNHETLYWQFSSYSCKIGILYGTFANTAQERTFDSSQIIFSAKAPNRGPAGKQIDGSCPLSARSHTYLSWHKLAIMAVPVISLGDTCVFSWFLVVSTVALNRLTLSSVY